jgi:hypothetical protein
MIPIAILTLLLLTSCVAAEPPADSVATSPVPAAEGVLGTVRIVGSAPMNVQLILQPENGRGIRVMGPLQAEIERLAGIRVRLEGVISPAPDPMVDRQIEATDYEIISVDGQPVVMGEIVAIHGSSGTLQTADGEEVQLTAIPAEFRVGQKVWVQGPGSIVVQSYGTIKP